jgi:hypothetical protein
MLPVIGANGVPVLSIQAGSPVGFDPAVFVRRNALLRQLPTDPIGFFRHHNRFPSTQRTQGSRAAAYTAPSDNYICHIPGGQGARCNISHISRKGRQGGCQDCAAHRRQLPDKRTSIHTKKSKRTGSAPYYCGGKLTKFAAFIDAHHAYSCFPGKALFCQLHLQ